MRQINTGKGTISLISLIAIWSISLVVDLPGLAISPLLSRLDTIFPHTSELEIQLLSTLPNFFIFPFILLSGKLSLSKSKVLLVNVGLLLFLLSGIAYFFAQSMILLIVISCVLGIGCGLVIPLAAGLLAEYFTGVYRSRQLGIKSGIANFSLIIATLVVGWIGNNDWHLPFVVYLVPIIPLLLSPFLIGKRMQLKAPDPKAAKAQVAEPAPPELTAMQVKSRVWSIIGLYFLITFCGIVLSLFIPFLMQKYRLPDSDTGIVNAVFYLFITLPGFFLQYVIAAFRKNTIQICILLMAVGLFFIAFFHGLWLYVVAAAIIGIGYGALQPIFYDKAARVSPSSRESSLYLAFVMSANYLGIAVSPFIINLMETIFHTKSYTFPFLFAGILMCFILVLSVVLHKAFIFYTHEEYYLTHVPETDKSKRAV